MRVLIGEIEVGRMKPSCAWLSSREISAERLFDSPFCDYMLTAIVLNQGQMKRMQTRFPEGKKMQGREC